MIQMNLLTEQNQTRRHRNKFMATEVEGGGKLGVNRYTLAQLCLFVTPLDCSQPGCSSEKLFPSSRDLPNLRIEPRSPALQANSSSEPAGSPHTLLLYMQNRETTGICCIAQGTIFIIL